MEIGNTLDVEIGATPQQLLPLIETNNSLATSNKALAESNKTLAETCQDQSATAEELTANNAELAATNKSLTDDILPTLRNGLQSKTVQPNEQEQVITADGGYIGLKDVTVKQSEYVPTIGWLGTGNSAYEGEIHAILDFSTRTSCTSMFKGCSKLTGIYKIINTQNVTSMYQMFCSCSSLQSLDLSGWDTSKVTTMFQMFYGCSSLQSLDLSGWVNCQLISNASGWNYGTNPHTFIGSHTLAEVEAGLTCFEGLGRSIVTIPTASTYMRYSSMLAIGNGIYDRSDMAAGTWQLSNSAFTYMRNDDDTIPDVATVTERQTRIRAIAAAKNYTLSL